MVTIGSIRPAGAEVAATMLVAVLISSGLIYSASASTVPAEGPRWVSAAFDHLSAS